jgi:DNA-binding CsgD family transcriptional regulator
MDKTMDRMRRTDESADGARSDEVLMQARGQGETAQYPTGTRPDIKMPAPLRQKVASCSGSRICWLTIANYLPAEWVAMIDGTRQVIGRSPDADIRIPPKFQSVSRRHAEIWTDKCGISLRDLHSTAGTRVNEAFIVPGTVVQLQMGDRISLGGLLLILTDRLDLPVDAPGLELDELDEPDEETAGCGLSAHTDVRDRLSLLTPCEHEILLWMCRGVLSDEAIGRQLHRSPNTIRTHVGNLLRKLKFHSRAELLGFLRLHR